MNKGTKEQQSKGTKEQRNKGTKKQKVHPIGSGITRSPGLVFKASALWADAFYNLKCPYACPSVRLSVCLLLRYRLNVFLPPLPKVGCPIFLEIQNPWGKVMERGGLRFEHFCLIMVFNRQTTKNSSFG